MPGSFSISPAKLDISLAPGEIFHGEIEVYNPSATDTFTYSVSPRPLTPEDEDYSFSFEDKTDLSQILSWVEIENPEGEIPPLENIKINYTLTVPENPPAGGQYMSFLVSAQSQSDNLPENSVQIKNAPKIASLLYATVAGETKREIEVLENHIKLIYLDSPITTSSFVKNSGNVHLPVEYSLTVNSLLDGGELYSSSDSRQTRTLFPGTKLFNEQTWSDTPFLGVFKITQEISYLGSIDIAESYALVCPVWFLVLVLAFFIAIILAIIERIKLYHFEKKHKKAEKELDENSHKHYNEKYKKVI